LSAADPICRLKVGAVVIGRNEGLHLERCLLSLRNRVQACVYVDSGSTDDSVAIAQRAGVGIICLDAGSPFTAARARNEGWAWLASDCPSLDLVQFVDGDCELDPLWLPQGARFLAMRPEMVAVSGRLRERYPDRTVFNWLCDQEWNTPVGEARAFGGVVLVRLAALAAVGGFRTDLAAGEEPELALRLRARGGRLFRLDAAMGWHDADMSTWAQWWARNRRSGHAFAQGAQLHGAPPERHFVHEARRAAFWGLALPVAVLALCALDWRYAALALVYPAQMARLALRFGRAGAERPCLHATLMVLGRFPEAVGVCRFWWLRLAQTPDRQRPSAGRR
jgi:GT2 family glycosyltransferase